MRGNPPETGCSPATALRATGALFVAVAALALVPPALLAQTRAAHAAADGGILPPGTRLCLQPVTLPVGSEDDERRLDLQRRVREALEAADFSIPDPEAVGATMDAIRESSGEMFDPVTGRRVPERHRALLDRIARGLAEDHGCDARVVASVGVVRAPFAGGTATWDGRRQRMATTGRIVLQAFGGVEYGWVSATSLWLGVYALDGEPIAFRSAGLEALVQMGVLKNLDRMPEDVWLTDPARIEEAIALALGPEATLLRTRSTSASSGAQPPSDAVSEPSPESSDPTGTDP